MSGAGLFCRDCPEIVIKSTVFSELTSVNGACIHLPSTSVFGVLDISDSSLIRNHGNSTGAIFLENVDLTAEKCLFVNNTAGDDSNEGDGGAVCLSCPDKTAGCTVSITNSIFNDNSASYKGGAIRWTDWKPNVTNCTFEGNQAIYGPDIASFAVIIANVGRDALENVASGQAVSGNLSAALIDHYGQIVKTDSESVADLLPGEMGNVTISGTTQVQAEQGVFTFQAFTLIAKPNSTNDIKIHTAGVNLAKAKLTTNTYQSFLPIPITFRACAPGESLIDQTCYLCPEGKYSLSPEDSCAACPDGAICYGNCTMVPKSGYWRETNMTDNFLECPNSNACLGSPDGKALYPTGVCAEGYYGNLCTGCLPGYSLTTRNQCDSCPDKAINILQTSGIAIGFALALIGIIKFSLISAQKINSNLSVFLKIFVNYLQLVAATSSFNMDWPGYALALFSTHNDAANVGTRIFSFDCLLDTGNNDNQADAFYIKIILIALMPLGIIAGSLLFWGLLAIIFQRKAYIKQHFINSIVVSFFVAHPSIVTFSFDVFNCRELNPGEYWLDSALNIRCWDKLHTRYALLVALPTLVLWGTLTPLLALLVLISGRNNLTSQEMRIRLGFLYTGYDLKKYYWEFIILYRKILVIAIVVFLSNVSVLIQALAVLFVLIVAFFVHRAHLPYITTTYNKLEEKAILVSAVTLYCGLFYISDSLDFYTKIFLFVVIVGINVHFLSIWCYRVLLAGCSIIVRKIPFLKRFTSAYTTSNDRVIPASSSPANLSFSVDRSIKVLEVPANSVLDASVERSLSMVRHNASISVSDV